MKNVENEENKKEQKLGERIMKNEQIKEEKIVNLFIDIIVTATLKEYYETCHKISKVQPAGSK